MIFLLLVSLSLYEQAVVRVLAQKFPAIEYLLLDAGSGRIIANHWPHAEEPIAVGSLTKPFLAAGGRDREYTCSRDACWLPRGHGKLRMSEAIAQSCNAWFLEYARGVHSSMHGLREPPSYEPQVLIGVRPEWRIAPIAIARAYPGVVVRDHRVRDGMKAAAERGTAQRLGVEALAKTGTAACSHLGGGPGDGLVVALWPADRPRYVLMVRVHGTTGAVTATTAGELLRTVRDGR